MFGQVRLRGGPGRADVAGDGGDAKGDRRGFGDVPGDAGDGEGSRHGRAAAGQREAAGAVSVSAVRRSGECADFSRKKKMLILVRLS